MGVLIPGVLCTVCQHWLDLLATVLDCSHLYDFHHLSVASGRDAPLAFFLCQQPDILQCRAAQVLICQVVESWICIFCSTYCCICTVWCSTCCSDESESEWQAHEVLVKFLDQAVDMWRSCLCSPSLHLVCFCQWRVRLLSRVECVYVLHLLPDILSCRKSSTSPNMLFSLFVINLVNIAFHFFSESESIRWPGPSHRVQLQSCCWCLAHHC